MADAIDDRIAEILDELLDQHIPARLRTRLRALRVLVLIVALSGIALMLIGHGTLAWSIWASTVTLSLAMVWTIKVGKP